MTEFEKAQRELREEFEIDADVTKSGGEADVNLFEEVETAVQKSEAEAEEEGKTKEVESSEETEEAELVKSGGKTLEGAEAIEQIVKSNISSDTLQLFDGEAVLGEVLKGFTSAIASRDQKIDKLTVMVEESRTNEVLIMKSLVAQNKEMKAERAINRATIGELVKALENTPVHLAPTGLRNLVSEFNDEPEEICKSYMDENGNINYDELSSVVKSALTKEDHLKTPGEKALQSKHLVVRNGNYKSLPKLFRDEIGLPVD